MIYEYAVDPQFIVDLADKTDLAKSWYRATGVGHPCIIAGYPEREEFRKVQEAIYKELSTAKNIKHRKSLIKRSKHYDEIVTHLFKQKQTRRYGATIWNGDFSKEHERLKFEGILSTHAKVKDEASSSLPLLTIDWLRSDNCPYFKYPRAKCVRRNVQEMKLTLKPLLNNASTITFVDPYFEPEERYKKPYKEYFELLSKAADVRCSISPRKVTIICYVNAGPPTTAEEFKEACHNRLKPPWFPENIRLTIRRIDHRKDRDGQQIHNRYILTDIGGVLFGHGTDVAERNTASCDDISLLEAEQLAKWRNVYKPDSPDFDWSEPPIIIPKE